MEALLKKLNYKNQSLVVLKNLPENLYKLREELEKTAQVYPDFEAVEQASFALIFVKTQQEIDDVASVVEEKIVGDDVLWFAYPKGSSKKYTCNFNRDTGWEALGKLGFEGVRMIAIDEDWSAFRFRRVEFIKSMARNEKLAMSEKGKNRTKKDS